MLLISTEVLSKRTECFLYISKHLINWTFCIYLKWQDTKCLILRFLLENKQSYNETRDPLRTSSTSVETYCLAQAGVLFDDWLRNVMERFNTSQNCLYILVINTARALSSLQQPSLQGFVRNLKIQNQGAFGNLENKHFFWSGIC